MHGIALPLLGSRDVASKRRGTTVEWYDCSARRRLRGIPYPRSDILKSPGIGLAMKVSFVFAVAQLACSFCKGTL